MPVFAKRILSIAIIAGLCFHFGLIFICASPLKFTSPKINFLITYYSTPFIYQNWSLFVPAPKIKFSLYVRYQAGNSWNKWEDILEQQISKNRYNRIGGHENSVLMFSNALSYALKAFPVKSSVSIKAKNDMNFFILNHEINQYLKLNNGLMENAGYEVLITSIADDKTVSHYIKELSVY